MKKVIKIKFTNGLDFEGCRKDILSYLDPYYEFIDSDNPDFIVFGSTANDIPPKGDYVRIGYYSENFTPDMSICDWGFGIPYEEEIKSSRYKRIDWHGFDPNTLIKDSSIDVEKIIQHKTRFCNFVYSNKVSYREKFFKELSKYKRIDAPGKSMNNMPSIDINQEGNIWERKQNFLSKYKFTISFENYSYPGYNTEKLLDPMSVNSIPIYFGNPEISRHFNTKSFVNAHNYVDGGISIMSNFLGCHCQPDFQDVRPSLYYDIGNRLKRKAKKIGRNIKMSMQFQNFESLIEHIIDIDKDDTLYANYLSEPWFYNNKLPVNSMIERWKLIFD
jgi:hypothetical protein